MRYLAFFLLSPITHKQQQDCRSWFLHGFKTFKYISSWDYCGCI